jgi:hypothetical protein
MKDNQQLQILDLEELTVELSNCLASAGTTP